MSSHHSTILPEVDVTISGKTFYLLFESSLYLFNIFLIYFQILHFIAILFPELVFF